MRVVPLFLVAFASIAMFSLQIGGLHLHANAQGDASGVHGAHVHDVDSDGHDHSADIDVSVLDLGIVWSKLMPVISLTVAVILAVVWTPLTIWPPPIRTLSLRHRSRWRPPLRAPPLSP